MRYIYIYTHIYTDNVCNCTIDNEQEIFLPRFSKSFEADSLENLEKMSPLQVHISNPEPPYIVLTLCKSLNIGKAWHGSIYSYVYQILSLHFIIHSNFTKIVKSNK